MPGYLVARAGHDAIREVGVTNIRAHNLRLTAAILGHASERGIATPTPLDPAQRTGWIGLAFQGDDRVADQLIERRIFVDYRPGCGIRVSPHFYTSDEEIEAFFEAIDELRTR